MKNRILAFFTVITMIFTVNLSAVYALDVAYYSAGNVQISAGSYSTSALNCDGTVISIGPSSDSSYNVGQLDTSLWTDIVQISSSFGNSGMTVGLKSDGTVVGCGANDTVIDEAAEWTGISKVAASANFIIGLKSDGTVVATSVTSGNYGQTDGIEELTDVVDIAAGLSHSVFLHSDGTVTLLGTRTGTYAPGSTADWTGIKAIATGAYHTLGLKEDGTVVGCGYNAYDQLNVEEWTNIVSVAAGLAHTVGLKSDGSVVAVGRNAVAGVTIGTCDVSEWTGVIQVAAGYQHTAGLKKDGTVVIVGNDAYGQCDSEELGTLFYATPTVSMITSIPQDLAAGDVISPVFSFYNYTEKTHSAYIITSFCDTEDEVIKREISKTDTISPGENRNFQAATAFVPDGTKTVKFYILDLDELTPYLVPYSVTEIE